MGGRGNEAVSYHEKYKLFTLNSNRKLASEMAGLLGCELGKVHVSTFSDGEIQLNIEESVRDSEIFVIQSTSDPVNEHLMELLIMIDALKRASASNINVIIPYFGYARQDRKARPREPITAKLVVNLLESAGATRVLTLDLHTPQIQGFFDIPVEHLTGIPILSQYYEDKGLEDIVVVAPHNGGIGRARKMANLLHAPLALVDKRKLDENEAETYSVIGNVTNKNVIIIDDLINTATTISLAAEVLAKYGAKSIYACCTHPVFNGDAVPDKIESSPIKEVGRTDTIQLPKENNQSKNKNYLSRTITSRSN